MDGRRLSTGRKTLDEERLLAMKKSIALGKTLQKDIGEALVKFTRAGGTREGAAEEFAITEEYDVGLDVAKSAVGRALFGYDGGGSEKLRIESYEGLIGKQEGKQLARQNRVRGGNRLYLDKKGIHGLPPEEIRRNSQKGHEARRINGYAMSEEGRKKLDEIARKRGKRDAKEGKGLFAMTPEQHKQSLASAMRARGATPYTPRELFGVLALSQKPEFRHRGDRVNRVKVAKVLNETYHKGRPVRNSNAVSHALKKIRKSFSGKWTFFKPDNTLLQAVA